MSELTPEEEALLAQAEPAPVEPVAETPVEVVEEPKKRGRKPRAAETDVEPAVESVGDLDLRVIPVQHHGDPWGDTPTQSRF